MCTVGLRLGITRFVKELFFTFMKKFLLALFPFFVYYTAKSAGEDGTIFLIIVFREKDDKFSA